MISEMLMLSDINDNINNSFNLKTFKIYSFEHLIYEQEWTIWGSMPNYGSEEGPFIG